MLGLNGADKATWGKLAYTKASSANPVRIVRENGRVARGSLQRRCRRCKRLLAAFVTRMDGLRPTHFSVPGNLDRDCSLRRLRAKRNCGVSPSLGGSALAFLSWRSRRGAMQHPALRTHLGCLVERFKFLQGVPWRSRCFACEGLLAARENYVPLLPLLIFPNRARFPSGSP